MNFESMTRDEAFAQLVELNVRRWGEAEREPTRRLIARLSRGLLINSIVHHALNDFGDAFTRAELATAKAQLTAEDHDALKGGG